MNMQHLYDDEYWDFIKHVTIEEDREWLKKKKEKWKRDNFMELTTYGGMVFTEEFLDDPKLKNWKATWKDLNETIAKNKELTTGHLNIYEMFHTDGIKTLELSATRMTMPPTDWQHDWMTKDGN